MAVVEEKQKIKGNLEFDVVIDGKYENRVSRGVLFEDNMYGCSMYFAGNDITLFNAMIALEKHMDNNGLKEKYEAYNTIMKSDSKSIDELEKAIDVLLKD